MAPKAEQQTKKVIGYVRVSRVGGRDGDSFLSPDLQRAEIERLAAQYNLDVVDVLEELDASGGDATRPKWNRAIEMVERGEVEGLVVWNLSRFSRSIKDALTALDRIESAGGVLYSSEGIDNTSSGRLQRNLLLAIGEHERERARDGFRAAIVSAVERGVATMSRIPFGYRRDEETRRLVVVEEEADLVRQAFDRRIARESWERIAVYLREQGVDISPSGVRVMISNRTYLGEIRSGDAVKVGAHPAIVSSRVFDAAQSQAGVRTPGDGSLTSTTLLQGVIRCGSCGGILHVGSSRYKGERVAHYYCRSIDCDARAFSRSTPADSVATTLLSAIFQTAGVHVSEPGDESDLAEAERALLDAQHALDQWIAQSALMDVLGADAYTARAEELVTERNVAQAAVEQARQGDNEIDSFDEVWSEWTVQSRREFLRREGIEAVLDTGRAPIAQRLSLVVGGEPVSLRDLIERGLSLDA